MAESVEEAETELIHLATNGRPWPLSIYYNYIKEKKKFGTLYAPIYASSGPPNPEGLAMPMLWCIVIVIEDNCLTSLWYLCTGVYRMLETRWKGVVTAFNKIPLMKLVLL